MILFYIKDTGEIIGSIHGRVHDDDHLKITMSDGSHREVDKLVIQWIQPEEGVEFIPDHQQDDIVRELENNTQRIYNYMIDLKSQSLIVKEVL